MDKVKNEEFEHAINSCVQCVAACEDAINYCLKTGMASVELVNVLRDCIDICKTTSNLMMRGSEHGEHLTKECREICMVCAEECINSNIEYLKKCADTCKACAAECIKFLLC